MFTDDAHRALRRSRNSDRTRALPTVCCRRRKTLFRESPCNLRCNLGMKLFGVGCCIHVRCAHANATPTAHDTCHSRCFRVALSNRRCSLEKNPGQQGLTLTLERVVEWACTCDLQHSHCSVDPPTRTQMRAKHNRLHLSACVSHAATADAALALVPSVIDAAYVTCHSVMIIAATDVTATKASPLRRRRRFRSIIAVITGPCCCCVLGLGLDALG